MQPTLNTNPKITNIVYGKEVYNVARDGLLLANKYTSQNVEHWWVSEKLDGYRAVWNGIDFVSRAGKRFDVPFYFKQIMPPSIALDGELWMGRGNFEKMGLVRRKNPSKPLEVEKWINDWKQSGIAYHAFDILNMQKPFEERMNALKRLVFDSNSSIDRDAHHRYTFKFASQVRLPLAETINLAQNIIRAGGEGVMLRKPGSLYEGTRSSTLLKLKPYSDMEVKIISHNISTRGKYMGKLSSFQCVLLDDERVQFAVSGMCEDIRHTYTMTHPVGSIITIKYTSLYKNGTPREATYFRLQ